MSPLKLSSKVLDESLNNEENLIISKFNEETNDQEVSKQ